MTITRHHDRMPNVVRAYDGIRLVPSATPPRTPAWCTTCGARLSVYRPPAVTVCACHPDPNAVTAT